MRQIRTLKTLASEKTYEIGVFEEFFKLKAKENPDKKITSFTFGVSIEEYLIHLFKKVGITQYHNFIKYLITNSTVNTAEFYRLIEIFKHLSENKDEKEFRRFMKLFEDLSENKDRIKTIEEMKLFCLIGTIEAFDFAYQALKFAESSQSQRLSILYYLLFCTDCSCDELLIHVWEKINCFEMLRANLVKVNIEKAKWVLRCLMSGTNCGDSLIYIFNQINCFAKLREELSKLSADEFESFINAWKRIPLDERARSDFSELELLCLLGTIEAFDVAFIEFLRLRSFGSIEERKRIL